MRNHLTNVAILHSDYLFHILLSVIKMQLISYFM